MPLLRNFGGQQHVVAPRPPPGTPLFLCCIHNILLTLDIEDGCQQRTLKKRKIAQLRLLIEIYNLCYQFRILRNLRIDIKDRLEEYSQSI